MKQIWKIIAYSRELWPYYAAIGFFTVVLALLNQVQPIFIKQIVDAVVGSIEGVDVDVRSVAIFVFLIFAADVGVTLLSNVSGYLGDVMAAKLKRFLSFKYYEHLLELPQSYFDQEKTGKIINRLNRTITELTRFLNLLANNLLQFVVTTVFTLVIVAYFSWPVALLLGSLYPIFIYMTARTSMAWQRHQEAINDNADSATGRFAESISQVKAVKAYSNEGYELKNFDRRFSKIIEITKKQSLGWHQRDIGRRLVLNVIFLFIYGFIFMQGVNETLSVGEMILLIQYAALIRLPLFSMSFLVDSTQRAVAGSKDFFEAMAIEPEIKDINNANNLDIRSPKVEFRDVNFSYDKGKDVLRGISFTIEPDTKLALVGESGEGKTTISNLLLRLYDPTSGAILIDGQDIAKVKQKSLRSNIGIVFQEPALFSGTIRENIMYGKFSASEKQMIKAAKAANAHGFIKEFKDGYNTEIGEHGLKLSGGQKQRVAIARAILKDPPVLILDEATSSLDSKAEAQVQEALTRLMKGRTTMIIAHRLSTIAHVETIVTLKKGKVDEIGSPTELAKTNGIYAKLLKLQNTPPEELKQALSQYDLVRER